MLPIEKALLAFAATVVVTIASCAHTTRAAMPEPWKVIDGDTIDVQGKRYRLSGYDAPETWQPKCDAERIKGQAAKAFLEALLSNPTAVFIPLNSYDRYSRELAEVVVEKNQVKDIMVWSKLGKPYFPPYRHPKWCECLKKGTC